MGYTDDRGKLDHTALARAYYVARDAEAEGYDRAVRIGSAATQVGRMGRSCGFGKSAKQQRRQTDKLRKWSAALHLRNFASDSASRALALGSPTFAGGCSTAEAVAIARRAMSLGRQEADVIEEDLVTALTQFRSDEGGSCNRSCKECSACFAAIPNASEPILTQCEVGGRWRGFERHHCRC